MKPPIKIIAWVIGGLAALSLLLWAIPGDQVFGSSRYAPGGGSPLSPGLFVVSGTTISPAPGYTLSGASGTSTTPTLQQVIAQGPTATSTPTFSGGLLFTNATGTGNLTAFSVSSTSATSTRFNAPAVSSASNPGYAFGNAMTGFWGNGAQINVVIAGNPLATFDGSNGFQASNITPLSPGSGTVGSASSPYLNATILNVTSTNVTTTVIAIGSSSVGCSFPTLRGSGASQNTGLYINNSDQIQFCVNGNTSMLIDPGEGPLTSNIAPPSPYTGMVGTRIRPYQEGNIFSVSGTAFLVNGPGIIKPLSNNLVDLGTTSGSWRGIYASGTEIVFGGITAPAATGDFVCYSTTGTLRHQAASCTVSSIRFKEHVESMKDEEIMAKVRALRGVTYDWKPETGSVGLLGTPKDEGFIAEEVAKVDPYLVVWEKVSNDSKDLKLVQSLYPGVPIKKDDGWMIPKTVDYSKISVLAIAGEQNLDKRLTALEKRMGLVERVLTYFGFGKYMK